MRIMHDDGDYSEADLEVEHPKDHAAGPTAVAVSMKRALEPDGREAHRADPAQAQPGRRLRLHELRVARPGRRPPAHRRVLRERRQGRRRGGHHATGSTPEFFAEHSIAELRRAAPSYWLGQQGRITHPMVKRAGRHPLRADRVGRRLRADRRPSCAAWTARTRRSSTPPGGPPTRRRSPTSCSPAPSAPTTCPTARTCATSRPRSPWRSRSASARPASASRTSTTPS